MKLFLWTLGTTSIVWLCVVLAIIAHFTKKIINAKKDANLWKFNCEAQQKQFQLWRQQYEKMESGDNNSDFIASLDILHNNGQNTNGKATTANSKVGR